MFRAALVPLVTALIATPAAADLSSQLEAFVVQPAADGTERLAPASRVEPGQVIEYRMLHTNTFPHATGGVTVMGPVPPGGVLDTASLRSDAEALVEVRGDFDPDTPGEEWTTLPAMKLVKKPDGTRTWAPAAPEDLTAVRWRLGGTMQAEAAVRHAYRVEIE